MYISSQSRTTLDLYIKRTKKYKILTKEEEHVITLQYIETKDLKIALKLVTANLRLVVKLAYEFRGLTENKMMDVIQEGNIGLMTSVRKFDPHRGTRLGTYARHQIRQAMMYYMMKNYRMVKLGRTQDERKLFFNLRKESWKAETQGLKPTAENISASMGICEKTVGDMMTRMGLEVSTSGYKNRDAGPVVLKAPNKGSEALFLENENAAFLKGTMEKFGSSLAADSRDLFLWKNRILSERPLTLISIGKVYNISKERVRQLEARIKQNYKKFLVTKSKKEKIDLKEMSFSI